MSSNECKYLVLVNGQVGNLGTKLIIEKKKDILLNHFSNLYLSKVLREIEGDIQPSFDFENKCNGLLSSKCIVDSEEIGKGGILASLWKLCERNNLGLRYSLRAIPIFQGTVEICNYFDINPYRLLTQNAKLFLVDRDYLQNDSLEIRIISDEVKLHRSMKPIDLKNIIFGDELFFSVKTNLKSNNEIDYYKYVYIGETNNEKKRLRVDGETESYLTKDYKDEIEKVINDKLKRK